MLCRLQVKGHIKEHNKKFTLSAVKDLAYEGYIEELIHFGGESDESSEEENSNSESDGSISSDGE